MKEYDDPIKGTMEFIFGSKFEFEPARKWASEMEWTILNISLTYVVSIFVIKYAMRDRKPYDLQQPLVVWNALLAIFSILGVVKITPVFLKQMATKGYISTFTEIGPCFTDDVAGYWTFLWIISKVPELLDTIFIVLRKRPLMLMHWYHHALTGYFAIVTYANKNAYMIWVVWLNFIVHSFMYSYYMLRSLRIRVPPQIAQFITFGQIIQFAITHVVMIHLAILALTTTNNYAVTLRGFALGTLMEVTYLVLWIRFYYISYYANGGKKYIEHKKNAKAQQ
uniref:Elongation of very long chain fatty acids protein n=2 Tax=Wuchereria bancrofti TaxID=6293 RepID=A0A1I8EQ07_WUCBA